MHFSLYFWKSQDQSTKKEKKTEIEMRNFSEKRKSQIVQSSPNIYIFSTRDKSFVFGGLYYWVHYFYLSLLFSHFFSKNIIKKGVGESLRYLRYSDFFEIRFIWEKSDLLAFTTKIQKCKILSRFSVFLHERCDSYDGLKVCCFCKQWKYKFLFESLQGSCKTVHDFCTTNESRSTYFRRFSCSLEQLTYFHIKA